MDTGAQVRTAVAVTAGLGVIGLALDRAAVGLGWHFPSFGYTLGELIWKAATIAALVLLIRAAGKEPSLRTTGYARDPEVEQPVASWPLVAGVAVVALVIANLVGEDGSAVDPKGGTGVALMLTQLLVRYPVTVIAEEALFRGWLQPRLGRHGLVIAALLWAGYHLQQVRDIPMLIVFGLALGTLRWWRGDVKISSALHYFGNALFFLTTYG